MERCHGGTHPVGKRERAAAAEARLKALGVSIGKHPVFGRADLVASHPSHGTVVVEVEGNSSRQREQAVYSALGQTVLMMRESDPSLAYALAVPDEPQWERHLRKIPLHVTQLLHLRLYLVSEAGVRELNR
jgi:hypothetical protein